MNYRERWDDWLAGLQDRYGQRRVTMTGILIIVGLASLTIFLLFRIDLGHSALLYLAVPYSVAVLITLLRPYQEDGAWWRQYLSHAVTALVVFLASSVILFEGFICVIYFMPIYFGGVTLAFIVHWACVVLAKRQDRNFALAAPLLVALVSLEGTTEMTSFDRHNTATAVAVTTLSPEQLQHNLANPMSPAKSDDWTLRVFPMPHRIEAGSLDAGDIHRVHTRYHRWFVTNTHDGVMEIRVDTVGPEHIATSVISDSSYFSSYVTLLGSDIHLRPLDDGRTEVSLAVHYERRLDPAWYFHPIQQSAMQAMTGHLLKEIIAHD